MTYTWRDPKTPLRPLWVVKCCDCLRYQSCEADDYRETAAAVVLRVIRESAIAEACRADNAPWGLEES